jgi:hypothetical protein
MLIAAVPNTNNKAFNPKSESIEIKDLKCKKKKINNSDSGNDTDNLE